MDASNVLFQLEICRMWHSKIVLLHLVSEHTKIIRSLSGRSHFGLLDPHLI